MEKCAHSTNMQNPKWNNERTTQQTFPQPNILPPLHIHQPLLSGPALHPQVRLIIPSPASLSWGACCQFIRLFLLISYFPQCKHPSPLSAAPLEGFRAKRCETGWCVAHNWQGEAGCDEVMISCKSAVYCTNSLQPSLCIYYILVYIKQSLVFVPIKCRWSKSRTLLSLISVVDYMLQEICASERVKICPNVT